MSNACEWCETPNSVRTGRKYCSLACSGLSHRSPLRACEACGVDFKARAKDQRACSPACRGTLQSQKVSIQCEVCSQEFLASPSSASARFCSLACKGLASRIERTPPRPCAACGAPLARGRRANGRLESNRQFGMRKTCSSECGVALAVDARQRATHVGTRRLLARSCDECGDFLDSSCFRVDHDVPGRTCRVCLDAALTDEQRARNRAGQSRSKARAQQDTLPTAHHHGYQWTGPELEVALRNDLTTREKAKILGRSYAATNTARQKALHDPKWVRVAGVGRS